MTLRKKKKSQIYDLTSSALYKLKGRTHLGRLLNEDIRKLESFIDRDDNYKIFTINKSSNKERVIEWPKPKLEIYHSRLLNLTNRIILPQYLHSGVKGRSYITNASAHIGCSKLVKLDIKGFYPATHGGHVFSTFKEVFLQAGDVAGILTKLCTVNNHIPTGSCISQILAYISHKRLFDLIDYWCLKNNLIFTLYVDDLTISGDRADKNAVRVIGEMINNAGLEFHKVKYFNKETAKEITGVILDKGHYQVPNKRQKSIFEEFIYIRSMNNDDELYELGEKLIGKLTAAGQLDTRFRNWIGPVKEAMKEVRERLDYLKESS